MSPDSPQPPVRPPHPLALELIARLASRPGAAILEVGSGSGRNTRTLRDAGFTVVDLEHGSPAAAALSTHGLLHGTHDDVAALLMRIFEHVEPKAPLFGTFGSVRDARNGEGRYVAPGTYAPDAGDERGVPHAFFDETELRAILEPHWRIESIREESVDLIAGTWAHTERPLRDARHWFVVATKRANR